jgi:hypothetical protein
VRCVTRQESVTAAVAALLSPPCAAEGDLSVAAAAAFFAARAPEAACVACAAGAPHAPHAHLARADTCAAAAAAAALLRRHTEWRAALDGLPAAAAAEACCLRLALASPSWDAFADAAGAAAGAASPGTAAARVADTADGAGGADDAEDDVVDSADASAEAEVDACGDAWLAPRGAVGDYALRRLGLSAGDAGGAWRSVPAWLLAVACGAHGALCDAYVAALLRPPPRAPGDVSAAVAAHVARADAAARLRCVLAAGGAAARRGRAALAAWGCLWADPPPAKRRRSDSGGADADADSD